MGRPVMPTQHCASILLSQPLPWVTCGLACITEERTYPALEPGRETAVGLDVHAEVGWSGLARGMRGAPFVLTRLTRGLGHENCTRKIKTASHLAVLLVFLPHLLPASLAFTSQLVDLSR